MSRLIGIALEGAAECQHRQVPPMRARVRHADRDLPFDAGAVESREHLQLFELGGSTVGRGVQIGEFLARRNQSG